MYVRLHISKRGVYGTMILVYNLLISNAKKVERCVRGVGLGADGVRGRWCERQMELGAEGVGGRGG